MYVTPAHGQSELDNADGTDERTWQMAALGQVFKVKVMIEMN